MQLFGAITTIIAAATSVSALPRPDLAKRDVGGVLMCQGANATGYCQYRVWAIDECHDVPEPWFRNVKTFLVDGDDFYCWPRVSSCSDVCKSPTGCTFGGAFYFDNPNKYDLAKISWDTNLMSFDCHRNTTIPS